MKYEKYIYDFDSFFLKIPDSDETLLEKSKDSNCPYSDPDINCMFGAYVAGRIEPSHVEIEVRHDESQWCDTCGRCDVEPACASCKAPIGQPTGWKEVK